MVSNKLLFSVPLKFDSETVSTVSRCSLSTVSTGDSYSFQLSSKPELGGGREAAMQVHAALISCRNSSVAHLAVVQCILVTLVWGRKDWLMLNSEEF